jgi:amino acid adenylation domain-containing protein/non-ribosomal peptide synthase protein (TIGR01720 family)
MSSFTNGIIQDGSTMNDSSSPAIPTYFPQFKTERCNDEAVTITVKLEQIVKLQELLLKDPDALRAVLKTAWALVIGCYTGQDEVSFGYRETQNLEPVSVSQTTRIVIEKAESITHMIERLCSHYTNEDTLAKGQYNTVLTLQRCSGHIDDKLTTSISKSSREVGLDKVRLTLLLLWFSPSYLTYLGQFAVHLEVYLSDAESGAFLHWWGPQMSVDQASNVASTLDRVLEQIIITPQILLSEVQYLSKLNFDQILAWNGEPLVEDARCIHEVIRNNAVGRLSAEAICCGQTSMSYDELHRLSDRLAFYLGSHGVVSGSFVPLCFDKSVWNVISMLGVMKTGAAFVPLDPAAPAYRLQHLVSRVNAGLILCSPKHINRLQQVANEIVAVDADMISHLPDAENDQLPLVKSTDVAYLIWTSGTTGEPKGTMIEHGAYCSGARAHGPAMGMSSQSRVLQFAAHVFDASLVEILTTLMLGAVVCIPTEDERLNDITSCIRQLQVNWAVLTPSFIGFIEPADVPELKTLVLAGEAMSESHVTKWSHIRLVNGYGPSECSVASVVNSQVTRETSPTNIGRATGVHLWVTEPENHEQLVPVGCVGELLIQGPTLARGYLNDSNKTKSSFLPQVSWTPTGWKIYKSGDLVRLCSDGSLEFVGRKDTQVKVHGQRVELGEIEHHLNIDPEVEHGLVLLPKQGPFRDRLIAVLSLTNLPSDSSTARDLDLVNGLSEVREEIQRRLSTCLPPYMVPTMLMIVVKVPLLASGKLDRRQVLNWVEDMSEGLYRSVVDEASIGQPRHNKDQTPRTEMENKLLAVWSHVLNLHVSQIDPNRSFLNLGGDSISAMLVKSRCAKNGIGLAVQDILRKSIVELANCTSALVRQACYEEKTDAAFSLSPIQKLYFQLPNQGSGHFNQSFFLRVCRPIHKKELRSALEIIVQQHSMLRARFSAAGVDDSWEQRITTDVSSSYRLRAFDLDDPKQATSAIADSQACLDSQQGPVFAADLFNVAGQDQLLFLVGHHLVIDLVSWRVILEDLEEILANPKINTNDRPFSFQRWCQLQVDNSKASAIDVVLPIYDFPVPEPSYWGIEMSSNTYGNAALAGFELDEEVTSNIMTRCHDALRTEPVDVLIAGLISSFTHTFQDRPAPAVYNEGHGRESSSMGDAVDLSRTVGWFTTMYPVYVSKEDSANLIDTVKHVKDLRRKIPDNGRPYFSSRMLTEEGGERFGHHWPLEITFNYLGQYQQLERQGALLKPVDALAGETRGAEETSDVGKETPRFGLVEISAVISQGKLRFSFTYNRHMNHQGRLRNWIWKCSESLKILSGELLSAKPRLTPGDFPLLTLTDNSLQTMVEERFANIGITNLNDVEDAYPCSSMQEGLLISQAKCSSYYAVHVVLELQVAEGRSPDSGRLLIAWNQVVDRHSALRTIFIESVSMDDGIFDQVVLKKVIPNITQMDCSSQKYALQLLGEKQSATYGDANQPPHRFTICKTSDSKIFCKLEISHAIMDGSSMSIIIRDLAAAYEGTLRGSGPRYSDYISFLQNQAAQPSVKYWEAYLTDIEPCIFPILNDGRPTSRTLRSLRLQFDEVDFGKLQRFCSTNDVTLSNAFHAAWAVTLRNYTASADICFGYLISGRNAPIPRIQDAVGPFVNLLVCRVVMDSTSTLSDVLQNVQQDYIDSLPHQSTSLAEVQHSLRLGGTPLFNTALSYRRLPGQTSDNTTNVMFHERMPTYDPTEYDVSVNIEASDQTAEIDLDYWTDYVSEDQAFNIGTTFLQALKNIISSADQKVGELNSLHQHHLDKLSDWNGSCPEEMDDCVHNVIQNQALEHPGAPAVCAWDAEFTYDKLDQLSSRLAKILLQMGVGPETFVPTCFDKSGWAIVAMLAVLKAGGAAVPLDAKHPRSALKLRVRDTAARVVLASLDRAVLFKDMGIEIISVNQDFLDQVVTDLASPQTTVQPTNPCFIIYTSGSTGVPKGVVLEHRAIVTSGHATGSVYNWGPGSRVLQFASYTFDNSLAEIFITLMRGGCVCVPSEHDRLNDLAGVINRMNVNFLDITPTVASFLQPSDVPTVKNLSLGGEPLTKNNIEVWGKAVALHCCYGPSECSINSTWNGNLGNSCEITNIGKSIGSTSWILNPEDQNVLMPLGCIGELAIEGPILARGYLNDPVKTSQSFIQNPRWAKGTERRIYKTGDLARYNSDGTITYLGRKDTQVKLNGQRIELGEIEHHIKSILPFDAQSLVELVTTQTAHGYTKALAVFFCLKEDHLPLAENLLLPMSDQVRDRVANLQKALSKEIPAYMIPNIYIPAVMLPMTTSGKLDRRRLRNLWQSLSEKEVAIYRLSETSGRAPSTGMETVLAQLWQATLGLQSMSVGPDDNFFKIGGDSIGAMKLITAARLRGISLTVADVFQQSTLSSLALAAKIVSNVDKAQKSTHDPKPFELLPGEVDIPEITQEVAAYCRTDVQSVADIYPCTAIQEGLVALSTKDPGAYVAQSIYELPSSVDIGKFCTAWKMVVESEIILQTRIVHTTSNGFLQVVVKEPVLFSQGSDLQSVVNQQRHLPEHNGGVLSTYTTIQEGKNWYFVWTAHHAVYDGWSLPLLLERVEALYHEPTQDPKTATGASYPRFIKYLVDINPDESDTFWKSRLCGTTATPFPALPNPAYQVHATATEARSIIISKQPRSHITLGSTVRAAWALTIAVYSGNPTDVVFGETLTGRDAPVDGITDMIGPTLATIPTRLQINAELPLNMFLDQVQSQSSAAMPFQHAGLQRIKHLSDDNAIACGFQNLLAIHHDDEMESQSNFWKLRSSGTSGTNFYSYPLTVSCQLGDGIVNVEAHYDEQVISTWLIQRLLAQFEIFTLVLSLPDRMHETLGNIQILNAEDHALISVWNAGEVSAVDRCVHQMIEDHANNLPEATMAVDSWDTSLTYAELDNISTKLAQYLLSKKISGKYIPLCFEKSGWTIVAMLAVLKSGSAFVPLDPAAPPSRLNDVISDIDATIILCSPRFRSLCTSLAPEVIPVDESMVGLLPGSTASMPEVDSNCPAYVIFTSGTTGRPKYVSLSIDKTLLKRLQGNNYPAQSILYGCHCSWERHAYQIIF